MKIKNLLTTLFIIVSVFSLSSATAQEKAKKINFTEFTVKAQDSQIAIDFKTDGATPTNYFEVQKSTDGVNFKTIAYILGPDPKQEGTCDCYGCFDNVEKSAKHIYYRAKHITADGSEQISAAKMITKS